MLDTFINKDILLFLQIFNVKAKHQEQRSQAFFERCYLNNLSNGTNGLKTLTFTGVKTLFCNARIDLPLLLFAKFTDQKSPSYPKSTVLSPYTQNPFHSPSECFSFSSVASEKHRLSAGSLGLGLIV